MNYVENEFGLNLSIPIGDVPPNDLSTVLSVLFNAIIRSYSHYCPGGALAKLITDRTLATLVLSL